MRNDATLIMAALAAKVTDQIAANCPGELQACSQWVGWKLVSAKGPTDKPRKMPVNPHTGSAAKANDPTTWGSFAEAVGASQHFGLAGVGFMFAEDGNYAGVDFADCIVDGMMMTEAETVVRALSSYTEISPSGCGVKVIVRGNKPAGLGCKVENTLGCSRVEVYDRARFFTVTGDIWGGTPSKVEDRQAELTALCQKLWPKQGTVGKTCTPSAPPIASQLSDAVTERCQRYLAKRSDAISGQKGHDATLAAACICFRFGLSDNQAADMMEWFNAEKCKPVWEAAELSRKLAAAKQKVEAAGEFGKMLREGSRTRLGKRPWHNHLPAWIRTLERPRLRPYQTAVLQAIADRCDAEPMDKDGSLGNAIIGYDELARIAGMSRRTAVNHVKRLTAMGLLAITEHGGIDFATGEVRANVYAVPGSETAKIQTAKRGAKYTPHHPPGEYGVQNVHSVQCVERT